MNTIQPNAAALQGIPGAPTRPAAPAPARAPQAPADQVTLSAPQPQVVTTPSGVQAQVLRNQNQLAFQAALPAGFLLPSPLVLEGAMDGKGGQVQARLAANPEVALPAGIGSDGRVYVQIEPGAPLVSFDPASLDYGLSSPLTQDASGTQRRQLQELVHADGSRSVIHDEQLQGGQRSFTRVDVAANGAVSAARVTAQEAPQQKQGIGAKEIGLAMLTGGMSLMAGALGGGRNVQQTALTAAPQRDGSFQIAGGSFMDHAKKSATGGFKLDSPLLNWWKGRNAPATTIVPFSSVLAANPGAVFPGLMAALNPQQ